MQSDSINIDFLSENETETIVKYQSKIFQHIMEDSESIAVQGYNENHEILYWNRASELLYGYSAKEALKEKIEKLIIPEQMQIHVYEKIERWIKENIPIPASELTLRDKKGDDVHVFSQHIRIKKSNGGYDMYCIDINREKCIVLQERLFKQKNFLKAIINAIPDLIWVKDTKGKYLACNKKFETLYGTKESEIIGKDAFDFMEKDPAQSATKGDRRVLETGESYSHEELFTFDNDHYKGLFETIRTPMRNEAGNIIGVLGIARDISGYKAQEKKLLNYANHDRLTGLANRTLFMDRLAHLLVQRKPEMQYSAVLFVDLDHFKEVNDTFGHATGDKILKFVSKVLQGVVRKEDTLSRFGGDEFTILLEKINTPLDAAHIAQKILDALHEPLTIDNHLFHLSASIGIAIFPDDSSDPQALLRFADIAMYKAKNIGRNSYTFYTRDLSEQAEERAEIEHDLHRAIREHQFILHYQPQINVVNRNIVGAEALVRWNHPEKGLMMPLQFISIAESSGQIIDIGKWVIQQVMEDISAWKKQGIELKTVSINLSLKQLNDRGLVNTIKESFIATGCNPDWIEFEVTERYAISEKQIASTSLLKEIRDLGCKISIDDFGTGRSSLAYLQHSAVQKIKIDQSFIQDIPGGSDDESIVSAAINIAKSMHLDIVAEGVETFSQQEFLLKNGCFFSQGFLYTEPIPKEDFEKYLVSNLN